MLALLNHNFFYFLFNFQLYFQLQSKCSVGAVLVAVFIVYLWLYQLSEISLIKLSRCRMLSNAQACHMNSASQKTCKNVSIKQYVVNLNINPDLLYFCLIFESKCACSMASRSLRLRLGNLSDCVCVRDCWLGLSRWTGVVLIASLVIL